MPQDNDKGEKGLQQISLRLDQRVTSLSRFHEQGKE